MKYLVTALLSLVLSATAHAGETYCLLLGQTRFLSNKVSVSVDYGEDTKLFEDTRIRNENGKVNKFNSMVDALNYMGKDGWVFVDAYAITVGNQNVYHWLLKREN